MQFKYFISFISFIILFIFVTNSLGSYSYGNHNDAILLEQVKVLTLDKTKYTNARRVSAIPQLNCVGGSARGSIHEPSVVQCKNMGSDGYDIQWECTADLNSEVKFGKTEVSCEGYSQSEDPYILRGSCGLEYTLEYTNPSQRSSYQQPSYNSYNSYDNTHKASSGSGFGTFIMLAVAIFIAWKILKQCSSNNANNNNMNGGGYGGPYGGGPSSNDNNDGYGPGGFPGYPKTNTYGSSSYVPPQPSAPGYQPGFWSGLGGGGLLGYLFGRSRRPSTYYGNSGYGSGYGSGYNRPSYSSGFGSGGFGGSSSSTSSTSRTASGFGGTKRR